jgi:hypothetical protein
MFTLSPTPEEKSEDRSCRSNARWAGSPSPSTCDHRIKVGTIKADRRGLGSTAECVFWLPPFTFRPLPPHRYGGTWSKNAGTVWVVVSVGHSYPRLTSQRIDQTREWR